jgi:hypothetical protein
MVDKKSWKEFRDTGMLWWVNMILHTFGWALVIDIEEDETISNCYPARVKFRGFEAEHNTEGYIKVSEYLQSEADELLRESRD